jgi:DNA-binding transcriptional MerR regulator
LDEKQAIISLTVKESAKHIGESPYVIRNWMRELKQHIPTNQGENGYHYFDNKAIERLLLIKRLSRDQGYSLKQIEFYFATGEDPMKPEKPPEDQIMNELRQIQAQLKLQEDFNQALIQRLDQQQSYISNSLNTRDQNLLAALEESRKARMEAAAGTQKKSFFSRIFSKPSDLR